MNNTNIVRPTLERIRQLAQQAAAAAPDAALRAANGAQSLLPGEVFLLADTQNLRGLELAVAHRATVGDDDTLTWDLGMEQVGPDLLVLVGCEPATQGRALRGARAALRNFYFARREMRLAWLLGGAAEISVANHPALSAKLVSLLQEWHSFNAGKVPLDEYTTELRIMGGTVEIAMILDPERELAALEFRIYPPGDTMRSWRLPPSLGPELMHIFNDLGSSFERASDDTISIGTWLDFLFEDFISSIGPMSNPQIDARQRVTLVNMLLSIPPEDLEEYTSAFQAWFNELYQAAPVGGDLLSQLRELHTVLHTLNDDQVAPLRALPEGWLEHDSSQRFTGQRMKVVRPPGWTTFGEVVASARELAQGGTVEE